MPDDGTYLLTNIGFSKEEKPILLLQQHDVFISMYPLNRSFSLTVDLSQRYCTGWRDITEGVNHACPDQQKVPAKYHQCAPCQNRTGFNPAFYHATSVSPQQDARNREPHILYLAHFGVNVVKVGISHGRRGHARLLEQGARSALILDEFPSAHIARQYEAKIAALPGIAESIQLQKKVTLVTNPYDAVAASAELKNTKQAIETRLGAQFNGNSILTFDSIYFPQIHPQLTDAHSRVNSNSLSGRCIGMIGSLLFCQQQEELYYIAMKKYVGYIIEVNSTVAPITPPPRQISLF